MKQAFLLLSITSIILLSCQPDHRLVQEKDVQPFLRLSEKWQAKKDRVMGEVSFWEKRYQKDRSSYVDLLEMAHQYAGLFQLTGEAPFLLKADTLYKKSQELRGKESPEICYAQLQNSITQHRFRDAGRFFDSATALEGSPHTLLLLGFDVDMELGRYPEAWTKLQRIAKKSSFDYLIRRAKWEDHGGNLDQAIRFMEKGYEEAEKSGHASLINWSLTNLSDMYSHAGRLKEAYSGYRNVLSRDSLNLYALKGIAWIAFSHDHDTKTAESILQYILDQKKMPDLYLTLADMAAWEGRMDKKQDYLRRFYKEARLAANGAMYNKYLIQAYTSDPSSFHEAHRLALSETESRPTPETYSWLALTYLKLGEKGKALGLIRNQVEKRCFEPDALLTAAYVYQANGFQEKASELFKECLNSGFELGPLLEKEIRQSLAHPG